VWTAQGERRASVTLQRLETLWFNTGTLCNLECANCYIESSPRNDRLVYLTAADVRRYLDETEASDIGLLEVGFTGGEPFMNPALLAMLEDALGRGHRALVLTNAMKPMMRYAEGLRRLARRYGERLTVRVSVDHFDPDKHEEERGPKTFLPMLNGLRWLSEEGIRTHVAGRTRWGGDERALRHGYGHLFRTYGVDVDAFDPSALVLFPEMDEREDVPEITTACWGILGVDPGALMCASSRMVVRRKGASAASVVACTLLPYDDRFELGSSLPEARREVALNHRHCATFCVLGGGSCRG
jgi:uncharacterized Fe-S cluster-containing radical SAM superfamily protein